MNTQRIYCQRALLPGGWESDIVLELNPAGHIQAISAGSPGAAGQEELGWVIAGMPNLHSHGFQRLMAGLTGPVEKSANNFWAWRETMYRIANRISPRQLEDCMSWVFAEMLANGYTSCAEFHYLHHQPGGQAYPQRSEMSLRVIAAAQSVGMALTLLPVLYCVSGFGKDSALREQLRFRNSLDDYLLLFQECEAAVGKGSLSRLGIAPHSLRAVPIDTLSELLNSRDQAVTPVHIHVAEQPAEVSDCLEYHGARPVELLLGEFPVNETWCLVHATHINPDELKRAAASGAIAGLCPSTEADLGDGFFDAAGWLAAGGRFGIGTDSNLRISPTEELRLLEFTERLKSGRRNVLTGPNGRCGEFLYCHAARSGAQALGQKTGELACSHRGDLVELDPAHPMLVGRKGSEIMDSFVFAGDQQMIRSVRVAGRQVVAQGRHIAAEDLQQKFSSVAKALLAS